MCLITSITQINEFFLKNGYTEKVNGLRELRFSVSPTFATGGVNIIGWKHLMTFTRCTIISLFAILRRLPFLSSRTPYA